MSGIIDDIIFQNLELFQKRQGKVPSTNIQGIFRKLKVNQGYLVVKNSSKIYQTKSALDTPDKSFLINLQVNKQNLNTKFTAVQMSQLSHHRINSKHNDILIMKQFFKRHKQFPPQANVYVNNGRTYLIMNSFLPMNHQIPSSSRIIEVYNSFILRNLVNFQNFIKKYIQNKNKRPQAEDMKAEQLHKYLLLTRILNTTQSTSNIAIDKTQFKFANSSFQKRKEQLNSIKKNIVQQLFFEKPAQKLYYNVAQEVFTSWLKDNYIPLYLENEKKFNGMLNLAVTNTQKKLEDFIYNMAKIEIKEKIGGNKPFNEGGFSYIFGALADITFISSSDLKKIPQNLEKVEKYIAIKKLKPNQQKKAKNKLDHQQAIIIKMRGSTSQFIPKYYGTQKQSQLNDALVMQLFQGDELDYYIFCRSETISLWSKIYLLLNVIHGMRHIINYRITHLDLKPINILVIKNMVTKLIDFGEAYHPQLFPKNYVPGLTFPYTAPEVFVRYLKLCMNKPDDDWQYSEKQDVYAFGVILSEVIFGATIFPFNNNKFKEVYLKKQSFQRFFLAPERVQDYGQDIIMSHIQYMIVRCLDLDPGRRPSFQWIGICLKLILNSYISIS